MDFGRTDWWVRLTCFILDRNKARLQEIGLYSTICDNMCLTIWATEYGISNNLAQFFVILELYYPSSSTFFTPNGKLGIELHEMWIVLGMPIGDYPYEEYLHTSQELWMLKSMNASVYMMWKLTDHSHICANVTCLMRTSSGTRSGQNIY